jgi:hypothetical protein
MRLSTLSLPPAAKTNFPIQNYLGGGTLSNSERAAPAGSSGGAAAVSQEYGGAMQRQQLSQRHRLAGLDVPGTSAAGSEGAHRWA